MISKETVDRILESIKPGSMNNNDGFYMALAFKKVMLTATTHEETMIERIAELCIYLICVCKEYGYVPDLEEVNKVKADEGIKNRGIVNQLIICADMLKTDKVPISMTTALGELNWVATSYGYSLDDVVMGYLDVLEDEEETYDPFQVDD